MSWDVRQFEDRVGIAAGDFRRELESVAPDGLWERVAVVRPDAVSAVATAFARSGGDILVAFTDRLNSVTLPTLTAGMSDSSEDAATLNQAVIASIRAPLDDLDSRPLVFAAIGPVEPLLMLEEITPDALTRCFAAQARAAADAGAEGFLCRSFSELEALRCAVQGIRSVCDLPVIGSMTFDAGADSMDTATGTTIPEACRMLAEAGAAMVGSDRGEYPDGAAAIVSLMVQSASLPVYVEINAGRPEIIDGRVVYQEPAVEYGERLLHLREAGAAAIGAGQGGGVEHVAQLNRARERLVRKGRRKTPSD